MKRTKYFHQTHLRQQSFFRVSVVIYFICVQWIFTDSAFGDAAAVEGKVTSPSRNEATNPLKEPTPSTLQGAFLGGNLTDANNGSAAGTSPAPEPAAVASTTAASAMIAETVWNARTAAVATLPVDSRRNGSAAATGPAGAVTDRPLESWENAVRTSAGRPSPSPSAELNGKNLVANMLQSWFDHKDGTATAAVADRKGYYDQLAAEYLRGGGGGAAGTSDLQRGPAQRRRGEAPRAAPSSVDKAGAAVVVAGNKSLFERWDEASEEQERVLEDAMRSEGPGAPSSSSSVLAADQNTPSRWFVLLLSGNSTVAQMRRTDFAKYLKLNLAARLSLEYDEVKINRVLVVPPRLMVNVSVVPVSERASAAAAAVAAAASSSLSSSSSSSPSRWPLSAADAVAAVDVSRRGIEEDDPLHNLVETNATLMELSGEEYRVERFMSLKSQTPQTMEETAAVVSDRHADIDFFIYATLGPLCFVVVLGFLLLTLYKYARKHPVQWPWKRKFGQPSFWPGGGHPQHRHRRMTDERGGCAVGGGRGGAGDDRASVDEMMAGTVNVIYSGEFEQSQQQQLSGSWLDDASFVPDDSLDRIRTPTLLRTVPAVKNKTFAGTLRQQQHQHLQQQCDDGDRHHGRQAHATNAMLDGQCAANAAVAAAAAADAAVHAQSPRLSRENKLRILGCKQSCLLLPAVQPVAVDGGGARAAAAATAVMAAASAARPDRPPSRPAEREDGHGGRP